LVIYNGLAPSSIGIGFTNGTATYELTNATTVTVTRAGQTGAINTVCYFTVVQFAATALNGTAQRGLITLTSQTSNTATISSVTTSKSLVNWGNFRATSGNSNVSMNALTLTNATTVTDTLNTAGTVTASYEVIQFA
jgi:hypothetical protein